MGENPLSVVSRITLAMFGVGVGIGLVALFTWEWIEALVIPDLDQASITVVEGYTPLAFILISTLASPLVAGVVGILEGLRVNNNRGIMIIAIGCLIGACLMLVIAGVFISQTGPSGEEEGPIGLFDLIALAGLAGIASTIASVFTAKFGAS